MSLEDIQWALIQGHFPNHLDPAASTLASLARDTLDGHFKRVLTSDLIKPLFALSSDSETTECSFAIESPTPENELARLCAGVACLHAFLQLNWTGPDLDLSPASLVAGPHSDSDDETLDQRAVAALAYGGEPAYHLARSPVLLHWALRIFAQPSPHLLSAPWWTLRVTTIHQYVLDEPVPVPPTVFSALEPLAERLSTHPNPDLLARLSLEQGILHHLFSNDRTAAEHFVRAARVTGLEYELTGALGKRTKFQQTELSQLVLLAESRSRPNDDDGGEHDAPSSSSDAQPAPPVPETLALNDDTLLEQTEFTSSQPAASGRLAHLDPNKQPPLHPLDQCILLALCLNVKNTSPAHGLTSAQMAPYVARVAAHPRNWSVHTMALLLRARLESARTRTVERATLQLQVLVDQMPISSSSSSTADADAAPLPARLRFVHAIPLPSRWRLERELAQRFLALGVVRSALAIFERLELWDDVVQCWQALERPERGVAIVRDLLAGRKSHADTPRRQLHAADADADADPARTAKLWCILGDLEPAHARTHYETAWAVSGHTSGRAMRALGGHHFARGSYAEAAACLQRAAQINPLQLHTWFVLGCALVRLERWPAARDAFARCVAIDDEDAESWSNLATVYLRVGRGGGEGDQNLDADAGPDQPLTAVPYANRLLAFRALRQGVKFSYDNWRMWANYMVVATDVGELGEACRALARVVELRAPHDGAACVDEDVLERLVDAVTREEEAPRAASDGDGGVPAGKGGGSGSLLHVRVAELFDKTLGPRVGSERISRAHARLLTWERRWGRALAAHLAAYRAGAAREPPTTLAGFRAGVEAVREVVDVLRNIGPRAAAAEEGAAGGAGTGARWRGQARGVVRAYMAKARDFEEEEAEWSALTEMMEELRAADDG